MSVQSERTKLVSCVRVFVKFVVFIVECAFRSLRTNEQDFLRNGYLQTANRNPSAISSEIDLGNHKQRK